MKRFFFFIYVKIQFFSVNTPSLLLLKKIEKKTPTLTTYYSINEKLWQEGLYMDFLQKKIADNWIKKFLINTAYLFSERLVFDVLIRFFINQFLIPFHKFSIFEFNSLANMLTVIISILMFFYFFYFYMYVNVLFF